MLGFAPTSLTFTLGSLAGARLPAYRAQISDICGRNHSSSRAIEIHSPSGGLAWARNRPVVSKGGNPIVSASAHALPETEQRLTLVQD